MKRCLAPNGCGCCDESLLAILPAKLAYGILFGGLAVFEPFLSVIFASKGLDPREVGALMSVAPFCKLVASPLWTILMDHLGMVKPLLVAASVLAGTLAVVCFLSGRAWASVAIVLFFIFNAPIVPVTDRCTLKLSHNHGCDWGRQRLWGAVTWGCFAPLAGLAYDAGGAVAASMPVIHAVCLVVVAALVVRMPVASDKTSWSTLRTLFREMCNLRFGWFLFSVACCATGLKLVSVFVFLRLEELGAPKALLGLSVTVSVVFEVPIFQKARTALKYLGARGLLCVALLCQCTRFVGYSLLTNPWFVLPLEPLHGITFACFCTAAVTEVHNTAPPGTETAAQGVLSAVIFGLGPLVGTSVGGYVYDAFSPAILFRGYAAVLATVLCVNLVDLLLIRRAAAASAGQVAIPSSPGERTPASSELLELAPAGTLSCAVSDASPAAALSSPAAALSSPGSRRASPAALKL
eukprot:TRINITY_DN7313_c0_g1_i1.p1 TRINITY_DN7313_c0_g1~~TRINITY_DN7313_c0_g1_i1.p1  ORF type:complete len:465 (+),score=88.16 TRINITY_DN7313_c0_g1_i1:114-1508(+)